VRTLFFTEMCTTRIVAQASCHCAIFEQLYVQVIRFPLSLLLNITL